VRGSDQLHAAFRDCAGGKCLELTPDLVNHDYFRVVVFDRFDHDFMLQ